ncbi:hypothetical protein BU17DRAFT_79081 [Hysterangium stoloniferum]|nr:hypothetical protein BU17DRAFT_79081 [Hysterangium stoloniferum]
MSLPGRSQIRRVVRINAQPQEPAPGENIFGLQKDKAFRTQVLNTSTPLRGKERGEPPTRLDKQVADASVRQHLHLTWGGNRLESQSRMSNYPLQRSAKTLGGPLAARMEPLPPGAPPPQCNRWRKESSPSPSYFFGYFYFFLFIDFSGSWAKGVNELFLAGIFENGPGRDKHVSITKDAFDPWVQKLCRGFATCLEPPQCFLDSSGIGQGMSDIEREAMTRWFAPSFVMQRTSKSAPVLLWSGIRPDHDAFQHSFSAWTTVKMPVSGINSGSNENATGKNEKAIIVINPRC